MAPTTAIEAPTTTAGRDDVEDVIDRAMLYVLQLSDLNYAKIRNWRTASAFIEALRQDGYVVEQAEARADATRALREAANKLIENIRYWSYPFHDGIGGREMDWDEPGGGRSWKFGELQPDLVRDILRLAALSATEPASEITEATKRGSQ